MEVRIVDAASSSKAVDVFATKEWKKFDKESGYRWRKEERTFAAYRGKSVVGYANLSMNGGAAYLSDLLVSDTMRRKGIGHLLIERVEAYAKSKNCHVIYLKVSERHTMALQFYKEHNYRKVSELLDNALHANWYFLSKNI